MPQPDQAKPETFKRVEIAKPIYGGAFLARVEGKAVFVPLTLPGEQVGVRLVEDKRGYATAELEEVTVPSPERIDPGCRHFGMCGGCHYQQAAYATQLEWKQAILRETLQRAGVAAPDQIRVLVAEPWGYRNRIRMALDGTGQPGYRGRRSHAVVPVSECPIAAPVLIEAALVFRELARQFPAAPRVSEIALFCNADETSLLASIFATGASKTGFEELARAFQARVPSLRGAELVVEERAGQPSRMVAQWGAGSLQYRAAGFDYRVDHGAFFQVNRWLVDALVSEVTAGHRGKLAWDLFAGVGLFARRLTEQFDSVIAVESAPASTAALAHNLKGAPAKPMQATTLDFLRQARKRERPGLIVVDPPRTGLGGETTRLLNEVAAPSLVYVSCDPATLARDLNSLIGSGYSIESMTLADLFPQTFHLETIVHLRRS